MLYPLSYGGGAGAIGGRKPGRRTNEATGIGGSDGFRQREWPGRLVYRCRPASKQQGRELAGESGRVGLFGSPIVAVQRERVTLLPGHELAEVGWLPRSWRQALSSVAGGQYGSEGGVRQPRVEAWSTRVRVARATIGRVSSAR
jgi:hypothetical protein